MPVGHETPEYASACLDAREQLYNLQQELLKDAPVLVQVGLNMPGGFALYPWKDLFADVCGRVRASLAASGVSVISETMLHTAAGPYCLLAMRVDGATIKMKMVDLEQGAARGRLWDIDVITASGALDRPALGLKPRKCLVCNESAHVCRKLGAHPPDEVIAAARKIIDR